MYTASSVDGRVTFTIYEEDAHSLSIMLPTGVLLKLPALDALTLYSLLDAHIEGVRREVARFEKRLPTNTARPEHRSMYLDLKE